MGSSAPRSDRFSNVIATGNEPTATRSSHRGMLDEPLKIIVEYTKGSMAWRCWIWANARLRWVSALLGKGA